MILYDDSFLETNDYQSVTIEDQPLVESRISTIIIQTKNPFSNNPIYFKDNNEIKIESKSSAFIILDWFSHFLVFKKLNRMSHEFYYIKFSNRF